MPSPLPYPPLLSYPPLSPSLLPYLPSPSPLSVLPLSSRLIFGIERSLLTLELNSKHLRYDIFFLSISLISYFLYKNNLIFNI